MAAALDDLPHPVPPIAKLRWKENWLFIVMAPDQGVYGVMHINSEPLFDRARYSCNFSIDGAHHLFETQAGYDTVGGLNRMIGVDALRLHFLKPGRLFRIDLDTQSISGSLDFEAIFETFDFAACRPAAPDNLSFRELMTLGTNLPHDHHQQSLSVSGELFDKSTGKRQIIAGKGYRDHSYCMRADSLIASHSWSALHFDNRIYGIKTARMRGREQFEAREGYCGTQNGSQVLTDIDVTASGAGPDGLGEQVTFTLRDISGRRHRIIADISHRFASLPLVSERPTTGAPYRIVENLCPITDLDTGECGLGHVELGGNGNFASD